MTHNARRSSPLMTAVSIVAAIALAVSFVAAGFAACAATPHTTTMLSTMFSGSSTTPFSHDQLIRAAVATRDYTVGSHDRTAVMEVIASINREAETRYADASPAELLAAPDPYTLDDEALSHLDDVFSVVRSASGVLYAIAAIAAVACIAIAWRGGVRRLGGILMVGGSAVLVAFALLAAWVIVDFNGFFAAFHSLFFSEGSWTFSSQSLLITMYPLEFWMGMGVVWLATTVIASILSIVTGLALRRRDDHTATA